MMNRVGLICVVTSAYVGLCGRGSESRAVPKAVLEDGEVLDDVVVEPREPKADGLS